jgi:D-beta-D-heptose 7-phosphate kinase/D-beta-D-heptose 1-phosphate adenosyltransferase
MLDAYLDGSCRRLCPEAPVPIVDLASRVEAPGGAANTAANAASLGARVSLVSAIGADADGDTLLRLLGRRGVSAEHVHQVPGRRTLSKRRVSAGDQLVVRIDDGSRDRVPPQTEERLERTVGALFRRADAVIVSDYGYGVMTARLIGLIHRLQAEHSRVLAVDARTLGLYRDANAIAMKPNYEEALRLLGMPRYESIDARVSQITERADDLLSATGAQVVAVTLDVGGAVVLERGRRAYRTYAQRLPNTRAVGAGDTFLATLALAIAAGAEAPAAAEAASAAASIVARRPGTACCSAAELCGRFVVRSKEVRGFADLTRLGERYRRHGRRIVLTNGCFDLIHAGHTAYLNRAKTLGDVLVVAVNSDASVRRLKGPSRPITALQDRLNVLGALSCVDYLVTFDDDTADGVIRALRPDVYVKGGDYTRERLPEAALAEELGGRVTILPYVEERSTSRLIERIRAAGEGAASAQPEENQAAIGREA